MLQNFHNFPTKQMDGTPPIFLSPEQRVEGDKIVLIFTVSFTLFIVLFFLISYVEPPDRFRRSETDAQKLKKQTKRRDAAERFVVNFHWLSYNLLLPGYRRIFKSAEHIASWGFIVVWIISIILLAAGLETITSGAARNDRLIITGLIVYFIAITGYFISRVLVFYKGI